MSRLKPPVRAAPARRPQPTENSDHELRGLPQHHPGDRPVGARADRLELFLRARSCKGSPGADAVAGALAGPMPRPPPSTPWRDPAVRATPAEASAEEPRRGARGAPRVAIDTPSPRRFDHLAGGEIDDLVLKAYRETIDPQSPNITLVLAAGRPASPVRAETGFVTDAPGVKTPNPLHALERGFDAARRGQAGLRSDLGRGRRAEIQAGHRRRRQVHVHDR